MELPDFQKYKDKFSQQGFFDKIQRVAKRAGAKLVYVALILYYLIQSDKVSLKDKAIIIGALGYLISLLYVLNKVWSSVDDDMKKQAREKLSKWFDDDEMEVAEDIFTEDTTDTPV